MSGKTIPSDFEIQYTLNAGEVAVIIKALDQYGNNTRHLANRIESIAIEQYESFAFQPASNRDSLIANLSIPSFPTPSQPDSQPEKS